MLVVILIAATLSGCATTARDLPKDVASVDATQRLRVEDFDVAMASLSCEEINRELSHLSNERHYYGGDIHAKRHQNQVAGYVGGVFFLPVLLATDNSVEAKAKIEKINLAKDKLYQLQVFKKCPV